MRNEFIKTLINCAKNNDNIYLLTGDLGFSFLERFQEIFPERFYNVGVAESNMAGIAAGLALSRKIVFIYSIAPFVSMRCFEQIRNDICMQNLNVRIIGVGGGFGYGTAGSTHHSIEDIAIMRVLPNMTVICPSDPLETFYAIEQSIEYKGPIYFRLGIGGEPSIHKSIKNFKISKGIIVEEGNDISIISTGSMLKISKDVSNLLRNSGISVRVISMHTIKPIDMELLKDTVNKVNSIFTIEEHNIIGGIGSAIAEILSESEYGKKVLFKRFGVQDVFIKEVGDRDFLLEKCSLNTKFIVEKIIKILKKS